MYNKLFFIIILYCVLISCKRDQVSILPDLMVASFSIIEPIRLGEPVNASLIIANRADDDLPYNSSYREIEDPFAVNISILKQESSNWIEIFSTDFVSPPITNSGFIASEFEIVLIEPGIYEIVVEVDFYDVIEERNEFNNIFEGEIAL